MRVPKPKTQRRAVVMGLDISLTQTGICVLHPSWDPSNPWRDGLYTAVAGYKLPEDAPELDKVKRLSTIVDAVMDALQRAQSSLGRDTLSDLAVFVEGYAFGLSHRAQYLGEVTGCVKLTVFRVTGKAATIVNASSWRKFLIGVGTGKGVKEEVHRRMRIAGAPRGWKGDECDAFGCANLGRSNLGMPALTLVGRGEA